MKTILILFVSFFISFNNCLSQTVPDERDKREYKEIISLYPKSLVSHFPRKIDDKKIGLMALTFPRGKYLSYIHLAISYEDSDIEKLKKKVTLEAQEVYHIKDSCLMVIPYNYDTFEIVTLDSIQNCESIDVLPIPNFRLWESKFPSDFYDNAVLYVLNAEKGRFLKKDHLSRSGIGLPERWLHGYTKGLTFYKNYVVYWLEVW